MPPFQSFQLKFRPSNLDMNKWGILPQISFTYVHGISSYKVKNAYFMSVIVGEATQDWKKAWHMYPADLCIQLVSFTKASFVLLVPLFPFFIQAISPTFPTSKFHSSPSFKTKSWKELWGKPHGWYVFF